MQVEPTELKDRPVAGLLHHSMKKLGSPLEHKSAAVRETGKTYFSYDRITGVLQLHGHMRGHSPCIGLYCGHVSPTIMTMWAQYATHLHGAAEIMQYKGYSCM